MTSNFNIQIEDKAGEEELTNSRLDDLREQGNGNLSIAVAEDARAILRDNLRNRVVGSLMATGSFLSLFDSLYMRRGLRYAEVEDSTLFSVIERTALSEVHYGCARSDCAEIAARLRNRARSDAEMDNQIDPLDRFTNLDLLTGEPLPGSVFGEEVVWVENGELRRRRVRETDFIVTGVDYTLPTELEPTPLFDQALETSLPGREKDKELILAYSGRVLLRYIGDQKFLVIQGEGRSGKGMIIRLIILLLGGSAAAFDSVPQIGSRFSIGRKAATAHLLSLSDMGAKPRGTQSGAFEEGATIIKKIVGQDEVRIEEKYKQHGDALLRASIIIATNFLPEMMTSGADAVAWRERLLIAKFPSAIDRDKRVPNIERSIFDAEGPAIARKCIDAFLKTLTEGYPEPPAMARIVQAIETASKEPHERFIEECIIADESGSATRQDVKAALDNWWAEEGNEKNIRSSEVRRVYSKLEEIYDSTGKNKRQVFIGMRVRI